MSRVYWHSPSQEAELLGMERAWLGHVAAGPAQAAWDFEGRRYDCLEQMARIIAMIPEVPDGQYGANYLHTYLREALAAGNMHDRHHTERVRMALSQSLGIGGRTFAVDGIEIRSFDLELNTALAAGSPPIQLAAKIHGQCEIHSWVDGPERDWLAGIIDQGLAMGIYREGMGWDKVTAMLRSRADEPVVMSYSVTDGFPNADCSDFMPPWPDGVPQDYNRLTEAQQEEREAAQEAWYELDEADQWNRSMTWLREHRWWARLAPDTLGDVFFTLPITVYDLLAPDRAERIARAVRERDELEEADHG